MEFVKNKTWKVFFVSTLASFESSPQAFRKYRELLVSQVAADLTQGKIEGVQVSFNTVAQDGTLEADSSILINIVLPPGIVKGTYQTPRSGDPEAKHLDLDIVVVNMARGEREQAARRYPVLMVKGHKLLQSSAFKWLEESFDCHIAGLNLPPHDLITFSLKWLSSGLSVADDLHSSQPLELIYAPPAGISPDLKQIKLTLPPSTYKNLEAGSRKAMQADVMGSNASDILSVLQAHIKYHLHLELDSLSLVSIGTSVALVNTSGLLKIFSDPMLVLSDIVELVS